MYILNNYYKENMKSIYWLDQYLYNQIFYFLDNGEQGIGNLLCHKIYNKKWKLNLNGFILNKETKLWFIDYTKFNFDKFNYRWAFDNDYINCLHYCYNNHYIFDSKIYLTDTDDYECFKFLNKKLDKNLYTYISSEYLHNNKILEYIFKNTNNIYITISNDLTNNNNLLGLKHLHKYHGNDFFNSELYCYCSRYGYLDIIKFFDKCKVKFNKWACILAIFNNQLECLKYCYNKCSWDYKIFQQNIDDLSKLFKYYSDKFKHNRYDKFYYFDNHIISKEIKDFIISL